jgi:predicted aspartyl protease
MSQIAGNTVQFRLVGRSNSLVLVPTSINGTGPYHFLFDSGATRSMISPVLASSLGISGGAAEAASGAGGATQLQVARLSSIAVGPVQQETPQVCISDDLLQIAKALDVQADGLIGCDFLKDLRVTIDYARTLLHFAHSSEERETADPSMQSAIFALTPIEPLIVLEVFANNHGPFQFALDTAAGRTVVSRELIEHLGISAESGRSVTGIGGSMEIQRAVLNTFRVGCTVVTNHAVVVGTFLEAIGAMAGSKLDGIIGSNFLSQFLVTIDCPKRRLELSPRVNVVPATS